MNVENLEIGKKYEIHAYKHDGNIHRAWDEAVLLEIHDDYLIFGNEKTKVTESDGRTWRTKEPAVLFFFYKDWYNIIGQNKKNGIYYYCNIASPFIVEENTDAVGYPASVPSFLVLRENFSTRKKGTSSVSCPSSCASSRAITLAVSYSDA